MSALLLFALVAIVVGGLVWAWAREFLFLMSLDEKDLQGRYDKVLWAVAMIVVPPLGLWAFHVYRQGRWPEALTKPSPAADLR